jgi:hypothetical protein
MSEIKRNRSKSLTHLEEKFPIKIYVNGNEPKDEIVMRLGIPPPTGLLILQGTSVPISPRVRLRMKTLMEMLARVVIDDGLTVLDGAVRSGVFADYGEALAKAGGPRAPYIGVTHHERFIAEESENVHSHYVVVEKSGTGSDREMIYRLAEEFEDSCPSACLFAGDGELFTDQMLKNVRHSRKMIVFAGICGAADEVLQKGLLTDVTDPKFQEILSCGHMIPFGIFQPVTTLKTLIRSLVGPTSYHKGE